MPCPMYIYIYIHDISLIGTTIPLYYYTTVLSYYIYTICTMYTIYYMHILHMIYTMYNI